MEVVSLWPVVKDSSIANITCVVDVSVQHTSSETRKRKMVNVYNYKPIVIWMPEAEDSVLASATIAIMDCHERNEPNSHVHAFPRSFYLSMFDHGTGPIQNSSPLVALDNAVEAVRQGGTYQFHFMVSKTTITLPTVGNDPNENTPLARLSYTEPVYYREVVEGFMVSLLFWLIVLCIAKVFAHKLLRVLKVAYGSDQ